MGLWSEQERWYLEAEDDQACAWVGFEGESLLNSKGGIFGGGRGRDGSETGHLAEGDLILLLPQA